MLLEFINELSLIDSFFVGFVVLVVVACIGFMVYLIYSMIRNVIIERRDARRLEVINRMTLYDYYCKRGQFSTVTIRGAARYKWRCIRCSLLPDRERLEGRDVIIANPEEALEHIHHHRTQGDKIPDHAIVRMREDIRQWEKNFGRERGEQPPRLRQPF
jgi:hypothetical protein